MASEDVKFVQKTHRKCVLSNNQTMTTKYDDVFFHLSLIRLVQSDNPCHEISKGSSTRSRGGHCHIKRKEVIDRETDIEIDMMNNGIDRKNG